MLIWLWIKRRRAAKAAKAQAGQSQAGQSQAGQLPGAAPIDGPTTSAPDPPPMAAPDAVAR
jgi:hypothetical protein